MAKKPKKQEYKASAAEKTEAKIASQEYKDYKRKYEPMLKDWREDSKKDFTGTLKSRANADVAQSDAISLGATENSYLGGERAKIATKAMLNAAVTGKEVRDSSRTSVLAAGRKQVSQTQTGLGQAARIGASNVIAEARNKMMVSGARAGMLGQIAGGVAKAGYANMLGGNSFWGEAPAVKTETANPTNPGY